ncbi:probable serine/threonine-protein kinase pkgA [Calliphora vicina]|uniref:probable serine/threonine-protein kinase pkgA n=1 Tax=Calliphora vicina TaxID=7373 RepID=UPI00325ABCD1
MQKSSRSSSSSANKEKPQKLRLNKTSDRNANSTSNSPTHTTAGSSQTAQGGTIRKSAHKRSKLSSTDSHHSNTRETGISLYQDENYMEFEFFEREIPNRQMPQFTELFRDFPVSYETTTLALQSSTLPAKPPPYRDPPPPTPPPLSQLPSRNPRNNENTQSCPSTPFRGKVVLSKKERKELSKLNKLQDTACSNSTSNIRGFENSDSPATSVQSSPYKGRVTELKNCIARINSKGLFASLHRNSHKSLNNQTQQQEEQATSSSNEISPPPPAPDNSPPGSNASNNNDSDYTEKLKNLPVRQRKAHTSHMDNYCLFDPMDFVNEKALRRRTHDTLNMELPLPQQQQGLRDPLFSSRQNLDFSEEELVPEVIYDEEKEAEDEQLEIRVQVHRNFDHHNYFVIDPEDFEEEPALDIGIPNPFTNEQLVQANLIAHTHTYANNPVEFKTSESLDKLLKAFESAPSMTNSQESKDTNTHSTTTTTSTALVESSTSTNSNTSSTSNTSSQTTLQRTKKRLTFLNLSPFRSHKTDKDKSTQASQPKPERAMSELVTSEHMFHLQRMLLSADNVLNDTRPINENIELNYVLFNPGPVPSRNVQYKIRKPRPLSTHSDADSGFLSPCSPDEFSSMKFNPALLVLQQCDSVQGYIEIYTDWANYYLERSKSKKKVTDLSADCRDGLLLAEVIEAVTSFKVPDLHKKPKNQQQMTQQQQQQQLMQLTRVIGKNMYETCTTVKRL